MGTEMSYLIRHSISTKVGQEVRPPPSVGIVRSKTQDQGSRMQQMALGTDATPTDWCDPGQPAWPPQASRAQGLEQLEAFISKAGRAYQTHRNTDLGSGRHGHVSLLSPYLRHRLINETEVLSQVLAEHSQSEAFKFIQEVFWRSYWKGWLEQRSLLWPEYQQQLPGILQRATQNRRQCDDYNAAVNAATHIPLFNEWCEELVRTGYLHNHARMWFASIWIFTLKLPWQLGADFFVRHLMDGDPASNTLGWRWVAGLHTAGKSYLATAKNIRTCAQARLQGRSDQELGLNKLATSTFNLPEHLSAKALQKTEIRWPAPESADAAGYRANHGRTALLLTEEDLTWMPSQQPQGIVALSASPRSVIASSSEVVSHFTDSAIDDGLRRFTDHYTAQGLPCAETALDDEALVHWLEEQRMDAMVCAYVPMGPTRLRLRALRGQLACKGISMRMQMRDYDRLVWPHASRGFFQLGKRIPEFLDIMRLSA
jgi:deoxyribodipyrimidine photo-lyase